MSDERWERKNAALREPSVLPPLTDEERCAFVADWLAPWERDGILSAATDAEAVRYLAWQRDNGSGGGPQGWHYDIPKRGRVNVVLMLPGPDAAPNRHGVLLGDPVRAGSFAFAEIVALVRHGRPVVQLSLF